VLAGPPGLAVGGALGGCAAAWLAQGRFVPVSQAVADLPEERRRELAAAVRGVLDGAEARDAAELLALVQGNTLLKARIAQELCTFFVSRMNVAINQPAAAQ